MKWLKHGGDAEDVLQEAFWQAWCRAGQYSAARGTPEVWLFVIARSRALDDSRRHRPERASSGEWDGVTMSDPLTALENGEAAQQVREALAKLPEEQRSAISLAFYEGLTYDQVARLQAIPLGTAKSRIRARMKRLRKLLCDHKGVNCQ